VVSQSNRGWALWVSSGSAVCPVGCVGSFRVCAGQGNIFPQDPAWPNPANVQYVVFPYNTFRKRGEVEQAEDTELTLLTEIRDILSSDGQAGRHTHAPVAGPSPDTAETTSADKS